MLRLLVFVTLVTTVYGKYLLGTGIADVTGPIAGITLMGYGNLEQQGSGVHLRQWSRAFIIEEDRRSVVIVSVDCAMMSDGVRIQVIERLMAKYGEKYNWDNVMISATHTHSGVGGYLKHILFDLPSYGFSEQAFEAMVSGIVKSIERAQERLQSGELFWKKGRVEGANINRSPTSYAANPKVERDSYTDDVDKDLTQLQFFSESGKPLGVINWFAVHATSMNYTNTLVSSDNMGYASVLFEEAMNPGNIIGKGPFVAAFASSNLGDVSPNVLGPLCHPSGEACAAESWCSSMFDSCFAMGPGKDMFESTEIIAKRIFNTAWDLWKSGKGASVSGRVSSIHQYVDMPAATVKIQDPITNVTIEGKGCQPAMGYSFAAGTIDGPFATHIVQQGELSGIRLVNMVRNLFLATPTQEAHECHHPKPILLYTGGMTYPFDWQPSVVSTQVALVGQLVLACVPGEFTTMSGRRMRNTVEAAAGEGTVGILLGLCNTYSDYITTYEEYQKQRFEAAANLYGPYTLDIHLHQYSKLVLALLKGEKLDRGTEPNGMRELRGTLVTPVVFDGPGWGRSFGQVLTEPPRKVSVGGYVTVSFTAGHPRNNIKLDDTYLTVERETAPGVWKVVATDANWETRFHWHRTFTLFGTSIASVEYFVPTSAEHGKYRIKHFGHYKTFGAGDIRSYEGVSRHFYVVKEFKSCKSKSFMDLMNKLSARKCRCHKQL